MEFEFDFDGLTVPADEVREIEVTKNGKSWGVYHVKHQFVGSPKWLLDWRRATGTLSKREQQRVDDPQTEEDILLKRRTVIRMFVESYIVDSFGIPGKGGEWKHSKAKLIEFLSDPRAHFVFLELDEFSSEVSNFTSENADEAKKK